MDLELFYGKLADEAESGFKKNNLRPAYRAIDWLMRHCSGCFGVDVGNFHLTDINYADDAVLFTDDPTKWDYVFRNFEAPAAVMGLHTNWHK